MLNYKNKKAQAAEATIWIVATLIIVVIIVTSIYATEIISKSAKTARISDSFSVLKEQRANMFVKQSLFAYALTKNNDGINIFKQIENEQSLPKQSAEFGTQVFKTAHGTPNVLSMILAYDGINQNIISFGYFDEKFRVVEKIKTDKDSALELILHAEEP